MSTSDVDRAGRATGRGQTRIHRGVPQRNPTESEPTACFRAHAHVTNRDGRAHSFDE